MFIIQRDKPELLFSSKEESDAYKFIANDFERGES
jgi:hypothetical protein